jgi:voltage-gated potassium channel
MSAQPPSSRVHGNAYNIFILVLTLMSLAIMALQILPFDPATLQLLRAYDNAICVVFLGDFLYNLTGSRPTRTYFIHQRGWLDLLGSVPTLGFFQLTALFRLARLSRLARITKLMGGQNRKALIRDVVANRGQYATFITLLSAMFVLVSASLIVLQVESKSPDANIQTGGDALWWALVTITTVGYGDKFPVTMIGRTTAVFVMLAGVGIIGALASILASLLVPDAKPDEDAAAASPEAAPTPDVAHELALLRAEISELRSAIAARPRSG